MPSKAQLSAKAIKNTTHYAPNDPSEASKRRVSANQNKNANGLRARRCGDREADRVETAVRDENTGRVDVLLMQRPPDCRADRATRGSVETH